MKKIILAMCVTVFATGCSQDDINEIQNPSSTRNEVRLDASIGNMATRVTELKWDVNDKIGVYIWSELDGSSIVANQKFKTNNDDSNSSSFTAVDEDDNNTSIYYPTQGDIEIIAYYPYDVTLGDDHIINDIQIKYTEADPNLLVMHAENVKESENAIQTQFKPALAALKFELTLNGGQSIPTDLNVKLAGFKQVASYDLRNMTFIFDESTVASDITLSEASAEGETELTPGTSIIPQEATIELTVSSVSMGFEYTASAASTVFESGYNYIYNVAIVRDEIILTAAGLTINPWDKDNGSNDDVQASK